MPRGAGPKREKEYEELKGRFQQEGRYRGREEEVAARIVNKQRREYGETKGAKQARRAGRTPDRTLPIRDFETLTIAEARPKIARLSPRDLERVRRYEEQHKHRKGMLAVIERQLQQAG